MCREKRRKWVEAIAVFEMNFSVSGRQRMRQGEREKSEIWWSYEEIFFSIFSVGRVMGENGEAKQANMVR